MPLSVRKQIEKSMQPFFWEGNSAENLKHLVKWNISSLHLKQGGLGIGNLKQKNHALLAKWGWRFTQESASLWRMVVNSIYGSDVHNWHSLEKKNDCSHCRRVNIFKHWSKVQHHSSFIVGNGSRIFFWQDTKLGSSSLKD